MTKRNAGRLLVETLDAHGVDLCYGVPGESYLAVLDAMMDYPKMRFIVCRHEGGAGFMALADAKMTGRPGVCFVSRGPGATNVSIAIHTAKQDAIPAVFFIGQIERPDFGRHALQEVDYGRTFSDMAKLVIDVRDPNLVADATARAFVMAQAGTPGPVCVVLPEDMLMDAADAPALGPRPVATGIPAPEDVARVAAMVAKAERPILIVGGAYAGDRNNGELVALSEALELPVCTVFRRPHQFPNDHANYGGYLGVRVPAEQIAELRKADLIVTVGARMGDLMSQGYSFPKAPVPEQPLVHVYPDPEEIGRVWQPAVGIACSPVAFVRALLAQAEAARPKSAGRREWIERLNRLENAPKRFEHARSNDGVVFGTVVHAVGKHLRRDAVVSVDAGNFSSWVHRYLYFYPEGEFIAAVSGAMGGGVPSAVAAGLRDPSRQLVAFAGDGGALMTGNELAVAMQYGVPVKLFVANNSSYGTIRMHQELRFPGRATATELRNPDFARWAEAFGAKGLRIENDGEVERIVAEAMAHDGPVVVDCLTSRFYATANKTMDDITRDGLARQAAGGH